MDTSVVSRHSGASRAGRGERSSCTLSLNRSLHVVAADPETFRIFGDGPSATLCGVHFCQLLTHDVRGEVRRRLECVVAGEHSQAHDVPVTLAGARGTGGSLTATAVTRETGQVEGMIVLIRPHRAARRSAPAQVLSDMDARVLEGVAFGSSTVQLADRLSLSRGGVEYHVASLTRRLRVKNRPALVSKAYSLGLFELGAWPPQVAAEHVR